MFDLRTFVLPYCLERQADGAYRVLNRRYEPLMGSDGRVEFARALSPEQVKAISFDGQMGDAQGRIYLYNDGCVPTASAGHWAAYSTRLQRLASWHIKT